MLDRASDKVNLCMLWIMQDLLCEIRAKRMDAPPPIVLRCVAALGQGMLGFHQAHKIRITPFPFPFAQLVVVLMGVFYIVGPLYIDVFTRNLLLTPVLSFVVPLCYTAMNEVSIELESPYKFNANDISVEELHEAFVTAIEDTLRCDFTKPVHDWDPDKSVEQSMDEGIQQRRERVAMLESRVFASLPLQEPVASNGVPRDSKVQMKDTLHGVVPETLGMPETLCAPETPRSGLGRTPHAVAGPRTSSSAAAVDFRSHVPVTPRASSLDIGKPYTPDWVAIKTSEQVPPGSSATI